MNNFSFFLYNINRMRLFFFIFGFGLTVISLSFIILYLNILTIGVPFKYYLLFISKRIECTNIFFGILLMILSMKGKKDELLL